MELRLIQRLVSLMHKGDLSELEIEDSQAGLRVRLRRGVEAPPPSAAPVVHVTQGAAAPIQLPSPAPATGGELPPAVTAPAPPAGIPLSSPMVGTFYRSSSPEAEAFVRVGSKVNPDSVVCIIEAMKVMNEIKAETTGEIVQILVENGEPVEFGQPLFLVKTA